MTTEVITLKMVEQKDKSLALSHLYTDVLAVVCLIPDILLNRSSRGETQVRKDIYIFIQHQVLIYISE